MMNARSCHIYGRKTKTCFEEIIGHFECSVVASNLFELTTICIFCAVNLATNAGVLMCCRRSILLQCVFQLTDFSRG
jgi:hypothetical protein